MAVVEIHRPNDEVVVIFVDGKPMIHADHDEHGWAGMRIAVETATVIAKALGAEVIGS